MIKVTATALIHAISQTFEIASKNGNNFQKRELILDDSYERNGMTYPNYVVIEFTGDKMSQLDNFIPGQRVTVEAFVNGREYNGRVFNTIKGQSVMLYQPVQSVAGYAAPTAATMPGYAQQPYQQAPAAYTQAASVAYPQQQAARPQPAPQPAYQQAAPARPHAAPQQQPAAYPQPTVQPQQPATINTYDPNGLPF